MAVHHQRSAIYAIILAAMLSFTSRYAAQTAVHALKIIHSFQGGTRDGSAPMAGIVVGSGGVLYGTTNGGGSSNLGTVFALKPPAASGATWTESVIHSFKGEDGGRSCDHPGTRKRRSALRRHRTRRRYNCL